jgi:hypothetical protein
MSVPKLRFDDAWKRPAPRFIQLGRRVWSGAALPPRRPHESRHQLGGPPGPPGPARTRRPVAAARRQRRRACSRPRADPWSMPGLRVGPGTRSTGDQPADVCPVLGWTDATDVRETAAPAPGTATSTGVEGVPGAGPPSRTPGNPAGGSRVRRAGRSATVVSVPPCRRNRPAPGAAGGVGCPVSARRRSP